MAHFARIENGIVRDVIVVENRELLDGSGQESEAVGQAFIRSIGLAGDWVQTSYNASKTGFRGRYAGIGDRFDASAGKFVASLPALDQLGPVELAPIAAVK